MICVTSGSVSSTRSLVFKILCVGGLIWLVVIIYMLSCIDRTRFGGSLNLKHDGFFNEAALPSNSVEKTQRILKISSGHLSISSKQPTETRIMEKSVVPSSEMHTLMQSVAITKRRIASKANELRFLLHTVNNLSSANSGGRYSHTETLHALEELTDALTNDLDAVKISSSTNEKQAAPQAANENEQEKELDVEIDQQTFKSNNNLLPDGSTEKISEDAYYQPDQISVKRRRKRRKVQKLRNGRFPTPEKIEISDNLAVRGFESLAQDAKYFMQQIQNRLYTLQNPSDGCLSSSSKTVVCKLNKGCGFGCQIHHVNYCLIMAYALNRTLLLDDRHWRYSRHGWSAAFRPLSQTCKVDDQTLAAMQTPAIKNGLSFAITGASANAGIVQLNKTSVSPLPLNTKTNAINDMDWRSAHFARNRPMFAHIPQINLPIIDALRPKPNFVPPAVPADLAQQILAIHAQPFIWWISQIMWFLWQLNDSAANQIEALIKSNKFNQSPIVGIHIRRTDKIGVEAALHASDEYMRAANEYFDRLENIDRHRNSGNSSSAENPKRIKRRVFIATDDASVLSDLRARYSEWEILGDEQTAHSAAVIRRNSEASLSGIVRDIELLSRTAFIVCTFSSQVCRVAYELMQARQTALFGRDASESVRSLDDIYYYGGQNQRDWEVTASHRARNAREIDLDLNDLVGVSGNHWDGLSFGINRRTQRKGLFPSYKVLEKVLAVDMPAKEYV